MNPEDNKLDYYFLKKVENISWRWKIIIQLIIIIIIIIRDVQGANFFWFLVKKYFLVHLKDFKIKLQHVKSNPILFLLKYCWLSGVNNCCFKFRLLMDHSASWHPAPGSISLA